jgi:hypothetical protein
MRPAQRVKQAEEDARRLKSLLSSSFMSQLLQRAPPAALTAEQEAQLSRCCNVIDQLQAALTEAPSLKLQLTDAMLKQQAACSVGSLLAWVQQEPEQQLLGLRPVAAPGHQGLVLMTRADGGRTASIWASGVHLLGRFAIVACLHSSESTGSCSLAANLTHQLEQSGKACSRNCCCTAQGCCVCCDSSCWDALTQASVGA